MAGDGDDITLPAAASPVQMEDKNFFMSHRMCRKNACREGFLETNKKTNYIARQETVRQIY